MPARQKRDQNVQQDDDRDSDDRRTPNCNRLKLHGRAPIVPSVTKSEENRSGRDLLAS